MHIFCPSKQELEFIYILSVQTGILVGPLIWCTKNSFSFWYMYSKAKVSYSYKYTIPNFVHPNKNWNWRFISIPCANSMRSQTTEFEFRSNSVSWGIGIQLNSIPSLWISTSKGSLKPSWYYHLAAIMSAVGSCLEVCWDMHYLIRLPCLDWREIITEHGVLFRGGHNFFRCDPSQLFFPPLLSPLCQSGTHLFFLSQTFS